MRTEDAGPTIVVVEEDPHVRPSLRQSISSLPVEVISVSGGSELIRLLLTEVRVIDMLIVNADLPWMNGLCLAALTRRWRRNMRMILLTRFPEGDLRSKVAEIGMADLLPANASHSELLALVRNRLCQPQTSETAVVQPGGGSLQEGGKADSLVLERLRY
jgi:DNA-binding response OmpR family regulator